jgi:hypothetical protein
VIAARLGQLEFDVDLSCDIDKAGPGLWFFAGLRDWQTSVEEPVLDQVSDAEFRCYSPEETRKLHQLVLTERVQSGLNQAPEDVFDTGAIYPFDGSDSPETVRDYLLQHAKSAHAFLGLAVKSQQGIIMVTA